MIRCLVGIAFATLGFGTPQITLTPYGYANTLGTSTPFQIVSVSSSPNTTVTLTLSESWIRFQSPSSSGCTNLVSTVTLATTATPKAVYGCLLSAPAFASLYVLVGASARGFASVSQPVPINVYPVGDLVISPHETTLAPGETKTIAVSVSGSIPNDKAYITTTSPISSPGAPDWLKEEDDCPRTAATGAVSFSCTATISIKQAQGLSPEATYSAGVQFLDSRGSRAVLAVSFKYLLPTVTSSALGFKPIAPCRVVDTRDTSLGGPKMSAGSTRNFLIQSSRCGIPSTAQAYALNVTVVPTSKLDYLTIWPSGQSRPGVSTLNSDGRVKANAAIVPAAANGAVSVYVTDATEVIVDVSGYFVPATDPAALAFYPITPCRAVDTRPNSQYPLGKPTLGTKDTRNLQLLVAGCPVASTAQAYSLNITAIPSGSIQFLTAFPTGQTRPTEVSTLNAAGGIVTANAAIVPGGTMGDVSVYTTDATDVIVDISGFFAPDNGNGLWLYTLTPCRALETREPQGSPPFSGQKDTSIVGNTCGVPDVAKAYALNATVVAPGALRWLTLWPTGQLQPNASTLNAYDGAITSNMAITATSNGSISAFVSDQTHLILDIFGYFQP